MHIFIFIFQIFLLILSPQNYKLESKQIHVYLQIGTSQNEISDIEQKIKQIDHVISVKHITSEEALVTFQESLGEAGKKALEGYSDENNPLPDSFIVEIDSSKFNKQVTNEIEQLNKLYESNLIMKVNS